MKSILVQLDEATYQALRQVALAGKQQQSRFIREAIRRAVRDAEYAGIRAAYEAQPDSECTADDWASPEKYKP